MADRYAGIDWASDKHDVLVAEEMGTEVLAATYAHDENGLSALCRVLVRLGVVLVAIERPDGLLVERLLDAGLRVLALHPRATETPRRRRSGAVSRSSSTACRPTRLGRTDSSKRARAGGAAGPRATSAR